MATEAALLAAVRLRLESAEPRLRPYTTALTNAATTGTTFGVADGNAWQAGDLAETPSGELALVISVSTNNLTVSRAYGTISVETLSSGDLLRKNPRFSVEQSKGQITTSLNELRGNGLYALSTETVTYTVDGWYDMTDTEAEDIITAWYIDDDEFRVPFFTFQTDPANSQPQVYIAAAGFTGDVIVEYREPYAAVTDLPARLDDMLVNLACYKLMGMSHAVSTTDPSKRVDRTVQGGQEGRDSVWFLREFLRLRDLEIAQQALREKRAPRDVRSQRARRFVR